MIALEILLEADAEAQFELSHLWLSIPTAESKWDWWRVVTLLCRYEEWTSRRRRIISEIRQYFTKIYNVGILWYVHYNDYKIL